MGRPTDTETVEPKAGLLVARDKTNRLYGSGILSPHRWLGLAYLLAGTCGAASAIVPPVQPADLTTLAVSIPAIAVGLGLIVRRRPVGERLVDLLLLLAALALSAGLWLDHDPMITTAGGVFYVWVAWMSGALSSRRQLAVQLVACGVGFSCAAIGTGVRAPAAVIVIVVGTSTAVGAAHRRMMEKLVCSEARLAHAAMHDTLTLLPNRVLVMGRLTSALTERSRRVGLLYVDLDGFKAVNDDLGHDKGDAVLVEAARRMGSCVRRGDTVARLGGDEFLVFVDDDADLVAGTMAARILQQMRLPFDVGNGVLVHLTASIGIVLAEPMADVDELVQRADLACLSAKHDGRDRIAWRLHDHGSAIAVVQ